MADPRSRRTGEHNPQIVRLMADAAAMREQIDALEARIFRLEAAVAAGRKTAATPPSPSPASIPPAATPPSKRPAAGPPPLPKVFPTIPTMPAAMNKAGGRRSVVDISEIAELVESIPPPAPGPPRPRK
jgi:hypothetical protein